MEEMLWRSLIALFLWSLSTSAIDSHSSWENSTISTFSSSYPGEILEVMGFDQADRSSSTSRTAGFYFPENIYSGIDDRQIFFIALTLQNLHYSLDFIITQSNNCQNISQFHQILTLFGITLDLTSIRLIKIIPPHRTLSFSFKYDIFITNGMEKIPPVDGIGKQLNIFVCKYPLDGTKEYSDQYIRWARLKSLSSYDLILVDSSSTFHLLIQLLMQSSFKELTRHQRTYPSIYILPPPSLSLSLPYIGTVTVVIPKSSITINVLITSAVSQPHCQMYLDLLPFLKLSKNLIQQKTEIFINFQVILTLSNFQEEVLCYQNMMTSSSVRSLSLTIISRELNSNFTTLLSIANLLWVLPWDSSFSNLETHKMSKYSLHSNSSPQLLPHVVLDLMLGGIVPILMGDSQSRHLLLPKMSYFLTHSLIEYVNATVVYALASQPTRDDWSRVVHERASYFQVSRYSNSLKILMRRYIKSRSFRQFTWTALPILRRKKIVKASPDKDYVAVIIEPHLVNTFEYVVKNVVLFTGMNGNSTKLAFHQKWALHVYHSSGNEEFVKFILRSIPNVMFHLLPDDISYSDPYTVLYTTSFWNNYRHAKKVLLFYPQTLMVQGVLDRFLSFDFVSSNSLQLECHTKGCRNWDHLLQSNSLIYETYRPGFVILCSPNLMIAAIDRCSEQLRFRTINVLANCINESQTVGHFPLSLPDEIISNQFCRVAPISRSSDTSNTIHDIHANLPLMIHSPWEYLSQYECLLYYKASLQTMSSCC